MKRLFSLFLLTFLASNVQAINLEQIKAHLPSKTTATLAKICAAGTAMAAMTPYDILDCRHHTSSSLAITGCIMVSAIYSSAIKLIGLSVAALSGAGLIVKIASNHLKK